MAVGLAIGLLVLGLSIVQMRQLQLGVGVAVGIGAAFGLLALAGWATKSYRKGLSNILFSICFFLIFRIFRVNNFDIRIGKGFLYLLRLPSSWNCPTWYSCYLMFCFHVFKKDNSSSTNVFSTPEWSEILSREVFPGTVGGRTAPTKIPFSNNRSRKIIVFFGASIKTGIIGDSYDKEFCSKEFLKYLDNFPWPCFVSVMLLL